MEIMKNRILSGELKPGDRLPPERELAEQLGFSRGSVNQGMLDLARMGFLRIVPRRPSFLSWISTTANPWVLSVQSSLTIWTMNVSTCPLPIFIFSGIPVSNPSLIIDTKSE